MKFNIIGFMTCMWILNSLEPMFANEYGDDVKYVLKIDEDIFYHRGSYPKYICINEGREHNVIDFYYHDPDEKKNSNTDLIEKGNSNMNENGNSNKGEKGNSNAGENDSSNTDLIEKGNSNMGEKGNKECTRNSPDESLTSIRKEPCTTEKYHVHVKNSFNDNSINLTVYYDVSYVTDEHGQKYLTITNERSFNDNFPDRKTTNRHHNKRRGPDFISNENDVPPNSDDIPIQNPTTSRKSFTPAIRNSRTTTEYNMNDYYDEDELPVIEETSTPAVSHKRRTTIRPTARMYSSLDEFSTRRDYPGNLPKTKRTQRPRAGTDSDIFVPHEPKLNTYSDSYLTKDKNNTDVWSDTKDDSELENNANVEDDKNSTSNSRTVLPSILHKLLNVLKKISELQEIKSEPHPSIEVPHINPYWIQPQGIRGTSTDSEVQRPSNPDYTMFDVTDVDDAKGPNTEIDSNKKSNPPYFNPYWGNSATSRFSSRNLDNRKDQNIDEDNIGETVKDGNMRKNIVNGTLIQSKPKRNTTRRRCSGGNPKTIVVNTDERSNFIPISDTRFVHIEQTEKK